MWYLLSVLFTITYIDFNFTMQILHAILLYMQCSFAIRPPVTAAPEILQKIQVGRQIHNLYAEFSLKTKYYF